MFHKLSHTLGSILFFASWLVLALLLFEFNYSLHPSFIKIIKLICYSLVGIYVAHSLSLALYWGRLVFRSYEFIVKIIILGALAITYTQPFLAAGLIILEEVFRSLRSILKKTSVHRILDRLRTQPAVLVSGSFLLIISIGTILLSLPVATNEGRITFFDALFTATSATCVTGLIVQDTGTFFSPFGQGVILALMQLGGLGIMTLSTSLAIIIGKRLSIRERLFLQNVMDETDYQEFARIIRNIFKMTFIFEGVGAAILSIRWYFDFGKIGQSIYYGIFHSVSAFCNAGFSLFERSFEGYAQDPVINLTISSLIIAGGLGFAVIFGITGYHKLPRPRHINLHLKMTLTVTALLLFGGMLFIFFSEYSGALFGLPLKDKLYISWFQSVTLRTAGFNTINFSNFSTGTIFLCMVMMFIGASPGSTGGGIKTTTVGVLFCTVRSMILGRETVEGFNRSIPWEIVRKSISITFVAGGIITIGVIALSLFEPFPLKETLFEVTSAVGTVGLSLDTTPKLSDTGRLLVTLLMFVGRIGPLTIAFLIGTEKRAKGYFFPTGKIVVG